MKKKLGFLFSVIVFVLSPPYIIMAADKTPEQLVQEAKAQVKEITIQDVKNMMDSKEKMIILDVRDKEEYEKEHIVGAINISEGLLVYYPITQTAQFFASWISWLEVLPKRNSSVFDL